MYVRETIPWLIDSPLTPADLMTPPSEDGSAPIRLEGTSRGGTREQYPSLSVNALSCEKSKISDERYLIISILLSLIQSLRETR